MNDVVPQVSHCATHGEFTLSPAYLEAVAIASQAGYSFAVPSPRCPQCVSERDLAEAQRKREDLYQRHRSLAGIPARFAGASFDTFLTAGDRNSEVAKRKAFQYATEFQTILASGLCMIWSGPVGTGKTHMACAVLDAVMRGGWSGLYTTILDASKRIKATYSPQAPESEAEAIRIFTNPSLLVLDEIGIGYNSDTERLHLWEILGRRYNAGLPSILISNLARPELEEVLGERIMDRMREGGGQHVVFDWASHRAQR